jgi:hypothetical protein
MLAILSIAAQVLAGYVVVDALSGIYHWATDRGFNIHDQIRLFQEHHRTNTMEGFDWQTFAAGMPLLIIGGWWHSPVLIAGGIFTALTQVAHYYAHRRSRIPSVHRFVVTLQRMGLMVHPAEHARHHDEPFDRDFCLLSGWNNWWLNRLVSFVESDS